MLLGLPSQTPINAAAVTGEEPCRLSTQHRGRRRTFVSDGLLLRQDIHCLFDLRYVTVAPDQIFRISARIREGFENGRDYYAMYTAIPTAYIPRLSSLQTRWRSTGTTTVDF